MPVGACPACWPVYAGVLASLGLGFLLDHTYMLPLTALVLALALASLAYHARERRGYRPFLLAMGGVGMILLGKFFLAVDALTYAGLAFLVGASAWNAWPAKKRGSPACMNCQRLSGIESR